MRRLLAAAALALALTAPAARAQDAGALGPEDDAPVLFEADTLTLPELHVYFNRVRAAAPPSTLTRE